MNFETKYWILKLKAYFDKGFSLLHYGRYLLMIVLLKYSLEDNWWLAIGVAAVWGIICFWFGYFWYKFEWILAEAEVGNRHNLLNKDLRKYLKKRKV